MIAVCYEDIFRASLWLACPANANDGREARCRSAVPHLNRGVAIASGIADHLKYLGCAG